MAYRVELSKSGRATCTATACKKEGAKIAKGDLRQGVVVTFEEKTTMKFRHWGCVTPTVLHNWKETCGMDMELVDGYEDLPAEAQKKVHAALEQEHVDDADWNGDAECNRYNPAKRQQGMFIKTPKGKKKKAEKTDGDEVQESPTKQPAKNKRGRASLEEEDDDDVPVKPAPKKTKAKSKKSGQVEDGEDHPPPVTKPKQRTKAEENDEAADAPAPAPKTRGRKAKAEPGADDGGAEPSESGPPKKSRGRKVKAEPGADNGGAELSDTGPPKKSKTKRGRAQEEAAEAVTAPTKRKGRSKKAAASEDD